MWQAAFYFAMAGALTASVGLRLIDRRRVRGTDYDPDSARGVIRDYTEAIWWALVVTNGLLGAILATLLTR